MWQPQANGGVTSPWTGKKWLAIGDSITQSAYSNIGSPYHKYIADKIGCTVINAGYGGTGYFNAASGFAYTRIDSGLYDLTADFVTVFLGTNDWWQSGQSVPLTTVNLGVLGDTNKTATFYGAVDYTLSKLAKMYNGKPVSVVTPLDRANSFSETLNYSTGNGIPLSAVADAIIKVARKYSMPVFDLYRESNFNAGDTAFKNSYQPDGLHPNDAGHQLLARKILSFINSL